MFSAWLKELMDRKHQQSIYHRNVNVNLNEKIVIQINWWNNDKCSWECNKRHACKKDYVWNPATYNCENGKYLVSIIDDSASMCVEIIESYNDETNFNEKKANCKMQNFYILLALLLIPIALLPNKISNKAKKIITISWHKY